VRVRQRRHPQLATQTLALAVLVIVVLIDLFVVFPEKLGDWPYNALGRNTRAMHQPTPVGDPTEYPQVLT
jgi:hypothetical protein